MEPVKSISYFYHTNLSNWAWNPQTSRILTRYSGNNHVHMIYRKKLAFIEGRDFRLYDFFIKVAGLHEKMNKEPLFVSTHTDKI